MSADASRSLPDSRPLHDLIGRARALLRSSWVATGLGITVGLLFGLLVVLTLIDLFVPFEPVTLPYFKVVVPLDPVFRCVALFLVVVPALLAFFHGVVRPLWRGLRPAQVARRIEDRLPGIHNRLVSAIDLEKKPEGEVSRTFLARLLSEALERIRGFRASSLLDLVSLRNAVVAAVVALSCSGVAWLLFSDRLPTAVARIFFPLADIPPASGVAYDVQPGSKAVLRDEPIPFRAVITKGEPDRLRVVAYGPAGTEPMSFALEADRQDGNLFKADVDAGSLSKAFKTGLTYRVFGGRTWSPLYRIDFVDRPVVAEVKIATRLPEYARNPNLTPVPDQAIVTGFEKGRVNVRVKGKGDVARGEIQLLAPTVVPLSAVDQQKAEEAWFGDSVPTGASPGGTWEWSTLRRRPVHTEPASIGTYGHWFQGDPKGLVIRPGDVLFAYVWVPEGREPKMIALEWHDGEGWEHRAYWGADHLRDGKPKTPSRFLAGPLPKAGEWARLEVPAAKVGLEGKVVKGIAFKMTDGQVYWGQTGRAPGLRETVKVIDRFPLHGKDDNVWEGDFPLAESEKTREGRFRVELRSSHDHPSAEESGREFRSRPDLPPAVGVDRKSVETVLAKPGVVPLGIDAGDDVGLDEVRLLTRPLVGGDATVRVLWSAGQKIPPTDLRLTTALKESAALKTGEGLKFVVEVQDTKKQVTRSDEYVIRIADGANSADKQLAEFDKEQDTLAEKLAKLLAEQKKTNERLAELEQEYAALDRKVEELRDNGQQPDGKPIDPKGPPEKGKELKGLTPEELKKLADLQKELGKLAGEEQKTADAAKAIGNELKNAVDKAEKLDLVPKELAEALNRTNNLFDRMVAKAMADLGKNLKDAATPNTGSPDVKGTKKEGEKIEGDLKGIKDRFDALNKARKELKDDVARAIKGLKDRLGMEDTKDLARRFEKDLQDLKDLIGKLRERLKDAREKNDDNAEASRKGEPLPKVKGKAEDLEKEIKRLLEKAKKMLAKGKTDDEPEFPDDPPPADDREKKVPPREEDTDEPLPMKKDKDKKDGEKKDGAKDAKPDDRKGDMDDEEKLYKPRLGGPREKLDPRYKKKQRPVEKKKGEEGEREKLEDRANNDSRGLDAAEKALKSDQTTLDDILKALKDAKEGKGKKGKDGKEGKEEKDAEGKDGKEGEGMGEDADLRAMADALRQLMSSKEAKSARQMAKDAKSKGQSPMGGNPMPMPTMRDEGNLDGGETNEKEGKLNALDAATRAMLLKLPPRIREDLLRGRASEGPEAYRAFIQDYFKRLTETKK